MILDKVYELEGLLRLQSERNDLPADFKDIIVAKARAILEAAEALDDNPAEPESDTAIDIKKSAELQDSPDIKIPRDIQNPDESAASSTPSPEPTSESSTTRMTLRFPINERIRFSKELFGGDMGEFDNTLGFVATLDNWNDVEEYFYSEMGWDPVRPEVGEYLAMLRHLYTRN